MRPRVGTGDGSLEADAALQELVRRYARLIHRAIARVAGAAAAELRDDVAQQVFISLWQQVRREQDIRHPASYIYKAAIRETVRAVREAMTREQPAGDLSELAERQVSMDTPERRLAATTTRAAIEAALEQLLPDRRRAVRAHLAGYDVNEIMTMFGWTYQQARNLIARGMADLRRALVKAGING
jgi:RNA polymerase sigma-70 factor (ECF subfamily)